MKNGIKKKEKYYFIAKYKPDEKNIKKLKILGEKFIENNKSTCKIIYKNKIYDLKKYFEDIDINNNHKDLIKFKIIFIHNIIDMSYMFYKCNTLISLSDNKKTNVNILNSKLNIINMSCMFYGCKSLIFISLPDISKWNTFNVNKMSNMFFLCNSLISLPDISKWNTSNVKEMQWMFTGCYSLISLPNISKWDVSNVNNMNGMFYKCNSLLSLPDISKWNTKNLIHASYIFSYCSSLISIFDISKWNDKNIKYLENIFYECNSLILLPDLSKWYDKNELVCEDVFFGYKYLIKSLDIYLLNKQKTNVIFQLSYKNNPNKKGKVKILDYRFVKKK